MLNFLDTDTFKNLIEVHQQCIFNVVLNMVQQWQDAEDITQDVFMEVLRKPGAFRGEAAVRTWLYRIAMNKCIDHLRKKGRGRKYRLWFSETKREAQQTDFVHPGVLAEKREAAAYLYKAMQQLPPAQKQAWILSKIEDLSYREISEVMQSSVSAVDSLIVRARKNLKKILSDMYPEYRLNVNYAENE